MPNTILTIDDKTDIRRLVRMTLEFEGHTVLEAGSGAEGLALARSEKPDLILLDVMMPEMDGFEVARILHADPELTSIPVVMLTALDDPANRATGLGTGVKAYLHKPFSPVELLQLIRQLLSQQPQHPTPNQHPNKVTHPAAVCQNGKAPPNKRILTWHC